jgi:cysteine desulfurase
MREIIYMDNNATTSVAAEALDAMQPFLTDQYFNPSSMYEAARGPARAIAAARATVAAMLGGVAEDELVFTGSATESNNTAIFGALRANGRRRHIVTTAVEHPSVLEVCKEARREGAEVTFVGVNRQGEIDMTEFVRALRPDTLLVSVMHANNETGVIFPIAELARLTKETDPAIVFHTDATQSVGKLDVNLKRAFSQVDMLSFSGHKLHGPKGVGVLFMRRGTPCRPYLCGGHQERGLRAGTENVGHIAALAKACELAETARGSEGRIAAMRDRLQAGLCERIPWLEVNGAGAERLPNTLNLACHSIEGESILYQLDEFGICASSGSACTSGSLDPSHVLKAMQVPFSAMHGSVRFSLSRYTTEAEVDKVIEVFPGIVQRLRRLSPYWDGTAGKPREMNTGAQTADSGEHSK